MSSKLDSDRQTQSTFTVDPERTGDLDVPSVTKLLNRKKLGIPSTNIKQPVEAAPPPPSFHPAQAEAEAEPTPVALEDPGVPTSSDSAHPASPSSIHLEPLDTPTGPLAGPNEPQPAPPVPAVQAAPGTPASTPRIIPGTRKPREQATTPVTAWNASLIENSEDPLERTVSKFFSARGAKGCVLFSQASPGVFTASHAIGSPDQVRLWRGLSWKSAVLPASLSQQILEKGFIEVPAISPGWTSVVRIALGAPKPAALTIFRVGTPPQPAGLLAVFTEKPLGAQNAQCVTELSSLPAQATNATDLGTASALDVAGDIKLDLVA